LDKRFFDKLSVSFGMRGEYFKTDSIETKENINLLMDSSRPIAKQSKVKPVSRLGINYQAMKATFIRASFGQGFRFPSVAERFIRTSASGLEIYPNDSLRPESGWSAEIGIKQGVKVADWKGFVDLAVFTTEYHNMMEFTLGQYGNPFTDPSYGIGFKSVNVGNTRISGVDLTLLGSGKLGPIDVNILAGYTYINPIKLDFNDSLDPLRGTTDKNVLKYRYRNTAKGDIELGYKKFSVGLSCRYNSHMENIDRFFKDAIPGVKEYLDKNKNGDIVFDARASYQLSQKLKIAIIVNNMLNREYISRPADMQPPRTFALQATIKF
jgi:iron complex outermembrane receptor protein